MYHDDIFRHISFALETYKGIYTSPAAHPEKKLSPEEYARICDTTKDLLARKEAVIYFNDATWDDKLIETGVDFFNHGILQFPYEYNLFVFVHSSAGMSGEPLSEKSIFPLWVQKNNDGSFTVIRFSRMPQPRLQMVPAVAVRCIQHTDIKSGQCSYVTESLFVPPEYTDNDIKGFAESAVALAIQGCVMLSLPHYIQEKTEIDNQLQKARIRRGKETLRGHITVKIRREIKDALNSGGGWTVKPHWRRGHVRTVKDGRKIPVRPCMVNWAGDADLDKSIYFVPGGKHDKEM